MARLVAGEETEKVRFLDGLTQSPCAKNSLGLHTRKSVALLHRVSKAVSVQATVHKSSFNSVTDLMVPKSPSHTRVVSLGLPLGFGKCMSFNALTVLPTLINFESSTFFT
eukprot:CAMPEP_0173065446 /NCGR_PEP_ID=MMETSP1102-20130122/5620_1 /TAXON_ID=49646 /ORGANISM="Geminigera sp., Strain Caron Lab Isolate" /LENGTH=109 /DNA_ID=CAMNT_0013932713 /DNA_START=262 /DNA_END=591 /DNA_ORIENTATION=-